MLDEKSFQAYYKEIIEPELEQFEDFRKKKLASYRKMLLLSIFFGIIIFIITFYIYPNLVENSKGYYQNQGNNYPYILPITIISFIGLTYSIFQLKKIRKNFNYITKSSLYNKIIGYYSNLKYVPLKGIESSIVSLSNILPKFDKYKSEDYIEGKYKSVDIKLSEIELIKIVTEVQNKDNRTVVERSEEQIFKGLFLITSFNKKFSSNTYILPNSWIKIFKGLPKGVKIVSLEDPAFEKIFDVYSDNQVESRYLLTPSFMERLIQISQEHQLSCSFIDGKMMMALPLKFEFLPSLGLTEALDYSKAKQVLNQLNLFFEVIDTLKLDINIAL